MHFIPIDYDRTFGMPKDALEKREDRSSLVLKPELEEPNMKPSTVGFRGREKDGIRHVDFYLHIWRKEEYSLCDEGKKNGQARVSHILIPPDARSDDSKDVFHVSMVVYTTCIQPRHVFQKKPPAHYQLQTNA